MISSPFTQPKVLLSLSICWLVMVLLHAYALGSFNWEGSVVASESCISNGLLLLTSFGLINLLWFYRPPTNQYWHLLIYCLLFAFIWLFLSYQLLLSFNPDQSAYHNFLFKSLPIRFVFGFFTLGWVAMFTLIWHHQQEQKSQHNRQNQAEKLAREAELLNLREQLNPHFLFNSLNSISALVGSRPTEARSMIHQLADFLRGTLRKDDEQWVSLQDEMNHLQLYLDIEKVRFGHRLQTNITLDSGCAEMHLPPMILQPIVENAIKFGLYDTTENVIIGLAASCHEATLIIQVENPYDPQTARPRQGSGFGLSSVQRRLYLLFARNDLVTVHANNHFFTTVLTIPQLSYD